jgi:hypothetical protein
MQGDINNMLQRSSTLSHMPFHHYDYGTEAPRITWQAMQTCHAAGCTWLGLARITSSLQAAQPPADQLAVQQQSNTNLSDKLHTTVCQNLCRQQFHTLHVQPLSQPPH